MEELQLVAKGLATRPTKGDHNLWLTWGATFALAAVGATVSNGPWQLCTLIFLASLPFCWIAAFRSASTSPRRMVKVTAPIGALALTTVIAFAANSLIRVPVTLDAETKATFIHFLRASSERPAEVLLSCPQTNEAACAYAEQFIPVLQHVPWKVDGPLVQHVTLGRFGGEILIADYGPPLVDPQDPDHGVWTRLMPWRPQVETAFKKVGITVTAINDPELPQTQTRIHFGRVPTRTLFQLLKSRLFAQ